MGGFSLGDYVTVNERLKAALAKFPDLIVEEHPPKFVEAPDGKTFVEVRMVVRRDRDDLIPMVGYIWEEYPGTTPYTKGSEQPNAATSCLGRILGYMGFGIGKSIASADDVQRRETVRQKTDPVIVKAVAKAVTYPNGDPVLDPFTDEPQVDEPREAGASKAQMGKIRALGKEKGIATTQGLTEAITQLLGRKVEKLDYLSKREASKVIESWLPPVIANPAGEVPDQLDEEPF
jgi:hypothetical protein